VRLAESCSCRLHTGSEARAGEVHLLQEALTMIDGISLSLSLSLSLSPELIDVHAWMKRLTSSLIDSLRGVSIDGACICCQMGACAVVRAGMEARRPFPSDDLHAATIRQSIVVN